MERLGNALVVGQRTSKPFFVLYGHTDTVPEQGNGTAVIRDGRMHGLGASDMKAGLAVMLHLLEDEELRSGPFDVIGVFYDKEEGPADENGLEDVLNGFPGSSKPIFDRARADRSPSRGRLQRGAERRRRVRRPGRPRRSPWLGDNAITKAGQWLAEMHARRRSWSSSTGWSFGRCSP